MLVNSIDRDLQSSLESRKKKISLYFHIPFCTKKCSYCHFFVLPDKKPFHDKLLEALTLDISKWSNEINDKEIISIYFGGGTPSLLDPSEIDRILREVERFNPFKRSEIEITLEANPETISLDRFKEFARIGINRLSVGVQTLDDHLLIKLGRTHNAKSCIDAVNVAKQAGIDNISIDLMYDIPCQTLSSWKKTLERACDLPIKHLSLYNLTIEPNTVFFKYQESLRKELPDAECSTEMYALAQKMFKESGLIQYEISAFAKDNLYSKHNTGYWIGRPFIGFGPSAFSYWKDSRFRAFANLNKYHDLLKQGQSPIDFSECLELMQRRQELLAVQIRLTEGVNLILFENEHGTLSETTKVALQKLIEDGFIMKNDETIQLTDRGILFYDTVATELI